ncbi:hypothetical protein A2690_01130 [Candidatus Roizmanbacteria bacterium RIFCSPHIGHO2_01_FULL_39_12b]|uniref:Uncharacterized protein n=1 Tax=Candidatus Roizmanbacteria bacterium RIFCSPHIGHO2_01_FULL_39_12b TaxID=1802030 RepID=A0A1F7G9Y9_9BACT|nr:MAG: hypothetical protein A2690_01130 [Candidatus Roizmanbacteria bacterium RIFCSPHIGHO2_01_FULL_39_12b]OGM71668.1 MAG: hypothetical protein A3I55_00200 [Candidatus Woesebacteria bacterium RIFCSPLOWO2_02_FULL_42_10]
MRQLDLGILALDAVKRVANTPISKLRDLYIHFLWQEGVPDALLMQYFGLDQQELIEVVDDETDELFKVSDNPLDLLRSPSGIFWAITTETTHNKPLAEILNRSKEMMRQGADLAIAYGDEVSGVLSTYHIIKALSSGDPNTFGPKLTSLGLSSDEVYEEMRRLSGTRERLWPEKTPQWHMEIHDYLMEELEQYKTKRMSRFINTIYLAKKMNLPREQVERFMRRIMFMS